MMMPPFGLIEKNEHQTRTTMDVKWIIQSNLIDTSTLEKLKSALTCENEIFYEEIRIVPFPMSWIILRAGKRVNVLLQKVIIVQETNMLTKERQKS
jgi:hypothetical protein